jgi:transcriptional regulator with XRE-family HTH domain
LTILGCNINLSVNFSVIDVRTVGTAAVARARSKPMRGVAGAVKQRMQAESTVDEAEVERVDREPRSSPIDAHVGTRIRLRRTLMGMSQERLGEALGLTFQQVQKYERGVNRVGASRLFDLSRVLDVPISFFFDDMPELLANVQGNQPGVPSGRRALGFAEAQDAFGDDTMSRRETVELVRAYYRISEPAVRKRVFDLVKSLAPESSD